MINFVEKLENTEDMKEKGFSYKYYGGEKKNPYIGKDDNAQLWWEGEKVFHDTINERGGDDYIARLKKTYDRAVSEGGVSDMLVDEKRPYEERLLIFYLDLWHGKWYPYDNWDKIFDY